jgi:hypothetical protein
LLTVLPRWVCPAGALTLEQRMGDRMTPELQFIIKAISPDGYVGWLTSPNLNGFRTISMRASAAVFSTHDQATLAITHMSPAFEKAGVQFSIEPNEQHGRSAAGTSA